MTQLPDLLSELINLLDERVKVYSGPRKGRPGGGSMPRSAGVSAKPMQAPVMFGATTLTITRKQAKAILDKTFPGYKGNKVKIQFVNKVQFTNTNWSGGSRNEYRVLSADGKVASLSTNYLPPWANPMEGSESTLPDNVMVVEHDIFQGKDMGITIYAHPSHIPKWLPSGSGESSPELFPYGRTDPATGKMRTK